MLAVSPLSRPTTKDGSVDQGDVDISTCSTTTTSTPCSFSVLDFPEFSAPVGVGYLLDSIDFDDLIHDGDMLPDLEMDTHFMAEFSSVVCPSYYVRDLDDDSAASTQADTGIQVVPDCYVDDNDNNANLAACWNFSSKKVEGKVSAMEESIKDDEIDSENSTISTPPAKEREKLKKLPSSQAKKNNNNNNNQGKRKTKVDWTPDLHRRFVQAVETLGVDKAVPSRILELMGIDCLTRHNVASHLQKYRSHRKHLLAREAEAASWSQKRQMYGVAVAPGSGGGGGWSKVSHPWHPPTLGFPPMTPPPPIHHNHPFRPLQVWGHPTHNAEHPSVMAIWPKQLIVPSSPHRWVAPPPTHHQQPPIVDPSFWHSHHHHVPNGVTPTTSQTQTTRFVEAPPVTGIPPPHATMYKPGHSPPTSAKPGPSSHPPLDLFPTKESIDAAIGDVLTKPWLPLPIGLKPPSTDSVMVELQRQGIPKIPPSCS